MVKTHYVNRKIDGLKLAQVVAKDFVKCIPPGTSHKAALRDPCVDLDLSGKLLNDDALEIITDALISVILCNCRDVVFINLEELCLRGNNLTADSLKALASVVRHSSSVLRDLDLSDNKISIHTKQDAEAWQSFLMSFRHCFMLRRLDLSGNALGSKGFEILAKAYARDRMWIADASMPNPHQDAGIIATRVGGESGLGNLSLEPQLENSPTRQQGQADAADRESPRRVLVRGDRRQSGQPLSPDLIAKFATTRGLRSIPYLVFDNTSMNDTCAMHLSYLIASHNLPYRLMSLVPPAKAGTPSQQLDRYDNDEQCRGIMYRHNEEVSPAGVKVLGLAEGVRDEALAAGEGMEATEGDVEIDSYEGALHKNTATTNHSITKGARRRDSLSRDASDEETSPRVQEMVRARSRIQGDTLRDFGVRSNNLWWSALKMLQAARPLLLGAKISQEEDEESLMARTGNGRVEGESTKDKRSPNTPRPGRVPPSRRPPLLLNVDTDDPRGEMAHHATLDETVWASILAHAVGAGDTLSRRQRVAVVRWAMDHGTLGREMDRLGKPTYVKIWKVLEGMLCLAYE